MALTFLPPEANDRLPAMGRSPLQALWHWLRIVALACITAGGLPSASASDDPIVPRPYVGALVGSAFNLSDADPGPAGTVTREIGSTIGGYLSAGVKYGPGLGIEIGRLQFGELGRETLTNEGTVDTVRAIGVTAMSLTGFLPLGPRWELTGRAGLALDASYATGQTCYQRTSNRSVRRATPCQKVSYLLGAGARYALTGHWGLRLEVLYLHFQDSREGPDYQPLLVGIGTDFRF